MTIRASKVPERTGEQSTVLAGFRALRPRQWAKNSVVVAAPIAAGTLFEPSVLGGLFLAFVSFSLLASCLYILNDIIDIDADRLHPVKRQRPIASGQISIPFALTLASLLAGASFWIANTELPVAFMFVLGGYLINTLVYSGWGKHEVNLDMLQVAIGFVLRAVAGAVAVELPMSQWFLGVAMFGSLLMVAGKRTSELMLPARDSAQRAVLDSYSIAYLHQVMTIAACAVLITYALWAFGDSSSPIGHPWDMISLAPFTYAVLTYLKAAQEGEAEHPELLAFTHRGLQVGALTWLAVIVAGVYL